MSGHSKWANIRVRKGAQDKKRGKIYTQHSKLIQLAAQRGGDPEMNSALRTAIDNAKADNVPNANIERAIKRGIGELKGDQMVEILYAAMAHGGVAVLIECMTDNKNRTISNVQSAVTMSGGKWTETSSVLFLFDRRGVVTATGTVNDDLELALIDAGAEDIDRDGNQVVVTTQANHWTTVRDALKNAGLTVESAGLKYVPKQTVAVNNAHEAKKILSLVDTLEEDEDVTEVHTNAEIDDAIVKML
jgi:YebC/PmpR family DNA-binding regulatory protein